MGSKVGVHFRRPVRMDSSTLQYTSVFLGAKKKPNGKKNLTWKHFNMEIHENNLFILPEVP
jgi:ribosomal protein S10